MSPPRPLALSLDEVDSLLDYDPGTGALVWRKRVARRVRPGDPAGCMLPDGYIKVKIYGVFYAAHRLAWLLGHKAWPKLLIDHINGNRSDNRLCNLREATYALNSQNVSKARSSAGLLGVTRRRSGFEAAIKVNGRTLYLGCFPTAQAAHHAYLAAKHVHHAGVLP